MNAPASEENAGQTELWLIRHGETQWSLSRQHTGRTDIPLTERGREQARLLAASLAQARFDRTLTSPMARAIETCRLAGLGENAEVEPELREWDYGIYEGRTTAEIREKEPGWSIWDSPIPEGESIGEIEARARKLVERLAATRGRIALFSHAHFLRILAGCWIGDSASLGAHLLLDTATISILGFERETRAIRQWNVRHPDIG
ncbi:MULTISPECIES: histidine phosphatase family protein [unclassified Caballeronia]|uniref:histidine phosphatase family protein n=1 Tax=unclassified Caballeronia TaxID=2646786 RepID=UPI0028606461|nr:MULTISPECIES: histidine phosphatase family protein [unclassified Caballeronia]MDR5753271.1 histidine phosphatase family protein [Caballeronia sp. LZ024]MDR5841010.1 histidine phosphatase family protein [Caballeronia sp. LZ031]